MLERLTNSKGLARHPLPIAYLHTSHRFKPLTDLVIRRLSKINAYSVMRVGVIYGLEDMEC